MKKPSEIKLMRRQLIKNNLKRPPFLMPLDKSQWPVDNAGTISEVWISNRFLVQVHQEPSGMERLSVCRTTIDQFGQWEQNLSWDELMQVKRETGRGELFAVEVLPEDSQIVNVANMRHIWVVKGFIGWRKGDDSAV